MRGLLIDPRKATITEVDVDEREHDGGARALAELIDVDLFTTVRIHRDENGGDVMFVDDMGMYRKPLYCDDIFKYAGYPIPLIGKAIVLGHDPSGESREVSISIEELERLITFVPHFCPESEFDCEYYGESEAEA